MAITIASADEQYKKFPQLNRDEVLKLQDWYQKQPHTPSVTGNYLFCFSCDLNSISISEIDNFIE